MDPIQSFLEENDIAMEGAGAIIGSGGGALLAAAGLGAGYLAHKKRKTAVSYKEYCERYQLRQGSDLDNHVKKLQGRIRTDVNGLISKVALTEEGKALLESARTLYLNSIRKKYGQDGPEMAIASKIKLKYRYGYSEISKVVTIVDYSGISRSDEATNLITNAMTKMCNVFIAALNDKYEEAVGAGILRFSFHRGRGNIPGGISIFRN